jgi:hypothetical protein
LWRYPRVVGSWIFALSPPRYLANVVHFDWLSCQ